VKKDKMLILERKTKKYKETISVKGFPELKIIKNNPNKILFL
jgi:hypothetical protein